MNKQQLIQRLSNRMNMPLKTCRYFLETLMEEVGDELANNQNIEIQNFGSFRPWSQTGRTGRNPRTGKDCYIQPRISVKFKPGMGLLEKLNAPDKDNNSNPLKSGL